MGMEVESGVQDARQTIIVIEVYLDFESCGKLAGAWDEFVERVSGDIFLTYDWQRTWWRHFGGGRSLRIYVFRAEQQIVGLVPMFVERVRLGLISVRRAKPAACDCCAGQFRPAIEADYLEPVLKSLVADLGGLLCDQIFLGPVAGRYVLYSRWLEGVRQACGDRFCLETCKSQAQTYYPLGGGYEQWLESLSSSQRNLFGRDYRNLEKQSLTFEFTAADRGNWEAMLDDFVVLHQAYWNSKGKLGHFGGGGKMPAFYRETAREQLERGRLRLFCLRCSDGSRAYSYNFRCGDMYFECILARSDCSPPGVSVSRLLHSETVRRAAEESVEWIDTMRGEYEYKRRLGGQTFGLRLIVLNRTDLPGRIRIRLFGWAAWLLDVVYYRIYYYRLAGWLLAPQRRKGLWRLWIRACSR